MQEVTKNKLTSGGTKTKSKAIVKLEDKMK